MPLPVPTTGSISDYDKQRLSLLASRISFLFGLSFGSIFTILGLLGIALYFRLLFAPTPFTVGCVFEVSTVTFAAAVVSLCFGAPVLRSTIKRSRASNEYLMPLFVFCAAAQAKAYQECSRTLKPAEILIPKFSGVSPRQPRTDSLVPARSFVVSTLKW